MVFVIEHNDKNSSASAELTITVWSGPRGSVAIRMQLDSHIGLS